MRCFLDSYSYLAGVYDEMMSDVDYSVWAGYLSGILATRGAKRLLEVSCGTGCITFELSKLGFDIVASDSSVKMLENAKRKNALLCADVKFVHQDMRRIEAAKSFDAVLSVCDGANYLDKSGLRQFLKSAYDAIKPDGALLFDINSIYKLLSLDGESCFDETDDAVCIWKNTFNQESDALETDVTIFARHGDLYKRFVETHRQYAHSEADVVSAAKKAGFNDIKVYECQTFDAPKDDTKRLQFVLSKV